MRYGDELRAALRWLDETDRIALAHFASAVPSELKADGTPVTAGDRAVEASLRTAIERDFPHDAILGEESGGSGSGPRRWLLDPIDGTKNYARGIPVFATLIALEDEAGLAAGVVSAPALGTRWWATRGAGAFRDADPIGVSSVARLDRAHLCTGGLDWAETSGEGARIDALLSRTARHRGFGDFWGYMLVAQGSMEVMIEFADLALWDVAAPRLIVEDAGGRWTALDGGEGLGPGPALASNGLVHDEVLSIIGSA